MAAKIVTSSLPDVFANTSYERCLAQLHWLFGKLGYEPGGSDYVFCKVLTRVTDAMARDQADEVMQAWHSALRDGTVEDIDKRPKVSVGFRDDQMGLTSLFYWFVDPELWHPGEIVPFGTKTRNLLVVGEQMRWFQDLETPYRTPKRKIVDRHVALLIARTVAKIINRVKVVADVEVVATCRPAWKNFPVGPDKMPMSVMIGIDIGSPNELDKTAERRQAEDERLRLDYLASQFGGLREVIAKLCNEMGADPRILTSANAVRRFLPSMAGLAISPPVLVEMIHLTAIHNPEAFDVADLLGHGRKTVKCTIRRRVSHITRKVSQSPAVEMDETGSGMDVLARLGFGLRAFCKAFQASCPNFRALDCDDADAMEQARIAVNRNGIRIVRTECLKEIIDQARVADINGFGRWLDRPYNVQH